MCLENLPKLLYYFQVQEHVKRSERVKEDSGDRVNILFFLSLS